MHPWYLGHSSSPGIGHADNILQLQAYLQTDIPNVPTQICLAKAFTKRFVNKREAMDVKSASGCAYLQEHVPRSSKNPPAVRLGFTFSMLEHEAQIPPTARPPSERSILCHEGKADGNPDRGSNQKTTECIMIL
jgi:hypothetical protein